MLVAYKFDRHLKFATSPSLREHLATMFDDNSRGHRVCSCKFLKFLMFNFKSLEFFVLVFSLSYSGSFGSFWVFDFDLSNF